MPDKAITTGIEGLDDDLQTLFGVCESDKLKSIKEAITDLSLSQEELAEIVPMGVMRLAYGFLTDKIYKDLLKELPEGAVARVEEAKLLIEKHFADILKHPAFKSVLEKEEEEEESLTRDKFNTICRLTWIATWIEGVKGGKLVPAVRIGFKDERGKILLDSTLDWEELSTLASAVTSVFCRVLEDNKRLAEENQLDLSEAAGIARRIKAIQRNLDKICKFGAAFGINIEGEARKRAGKR